MNVITKAIESDIVECWAKSPLIRYAVVPFGTILLFMFISGILDEAFGVATIIWASMWIVSPFIAMIIPTINRLSAKSGLSAFECAAIDSYRDLTEREAQNFPSNTFDLLKSGDSEIINDFRAAYSQIRHVRESTDYRIIDGREKMAVAKRNIEFHAEMIKEFG